MVRRLKPNWPINLRFISIKFANGKIHSLRVPPISSATVGTNKKKDDASLIARLY